MTTVTKFDRGTKKKPGHLNMIVPSQQVLVVGMTRKGPDSMFSVKLEDGQILTVPGAWLGGVDKGKKAWEDYQAFLAEQQRAFDEQQQRRKSLLAEMRQKVALTGEA